MWPAHANYIIQEYILETSHEQLKPWARKLATTATWLGAAIWFFITAREKTESSAIYHLH